MRALQGDSTGVAGLRSPQRSLDSASSVAAAAAAWVAGLASAASGNDPGASHAWFPMLSDPAVWLCGFMVSIVQLN